MNSKGVTLVELVVVLAVVAILAAIAMPSLHDFLQEQRRKVVAQELAFTLRMARSEAILRQTPVVVRGFHRGWGWGWVTLLDIRGLSTARGTHLNTHILDGKVPVIGNKWVRHEVRFDSFGAPAGVKGQSNAGSLFFCDPKRARLRWRVVIDWVGRVRITDLPDPESADWCGKPH